MKIIYYKKDESRIFYDSHFNFVGSGSFAWQWTLASKKNTSSLIVTGRFIREIPGQAGDDILTG